MFKHIFMNESLRDSIHSRRLHHQLFPMELRYETGFDNEIVEKLKIFGHKRAVVSPEDGFAVIVGISKRSGEIEGEIDPRRGGGSVEIF